MEGVSGLLAAFGGESSKHIRQYNRSSGELHLTNGAIVYTAGADSFARKIEGTNLTAVWCDEVGLWSLHRWQRTWEQAITFAVRKDPSLFIITGTPKQGHPLVQRLVADPTVLTVVMSTADNKALDPKQVAELTAMYAGTRLGRQELLGELLLDTPGALWTTANIEAYRLTEVPSPEDMIRVVVGWDPAVTSNENSDEHGIIVAAQIAGDPAHFAILEDGSGRYTPLQAVNKVRDLFEKWDANNVVAEVNNGGDLIEALLQTGGTIIPLIKVHATRGKRIRAEPVSILSEQGKLHLVGAFPKLEDQMTTWSPESAGSPDRLDAMVWAVTALKEKTAKSRAFIGNHRISVRSK
jgi:phage terminase large subunit-like protein